MEFAIEIAWYFSVRHKSILRRCDTAYGKDAVHAVAATTITD
jgi:hypothetical protein